MNDLGTPAEMSNARVLRQRTDAAAARWAEYGRAELALVHAQAARDLAYKRAVRAMRAVRLVSR
jgi:hypothetical protein